MERSVRLTMFNQTFSQTIGNFNQSNSLEMEEELKEELNVGEGFDYLH